MEFLRWIFFFPAAWVAQFIVKWFFTFLQLLIGTSLILDLFGEPFGKFVVLILMSFQIMVGVYAFTYVGMLVSPRKPKKTFLLKLIPLVAFVWAFGIMTLVYRNYLPFDLWLLDEYVPFATQRYLSIFTGYIPAMLSIWFFNPLRTFLLNVRS